MRQSGQTPSRRIACSEVLTPQGQLLTRQVLNLSDRGCVVRVHPLEGETAQTLWLRGRVVLEQTDEGVRAFYKGKLLTKNTKGL